MYERLKKKATIYINIHIIFVLLLSTFMTFFVICDHIILSEIVNLSRKLWLLRIAKCFLLCGGLIICYTWGRVTMLHDLENFSPSSHKSFLRNYYTNIITELEEENGKLKQRAYINMAELEEKRA